MSGVGSNCSFLIVTDNEEIIRYSQPVKNLDKICAKLKKFSLNSNQEEFFKELSKRPFTEIDE